MAGDELFVPVGTSDPLQVSAFRLSD